MENLTAVKRFYKSKTFWVNVVAIVAMVLQSETNFIIPAEAQVSVLALINLILRSITKDEIDWELFEGSDSED